MFLPLTDLLTCPRCGPEHGLILLAERISDRRVLEGALGCPRCRTRYPVAGGFADLRPEPGAALSAARAEPVEGAGEEAVRLAALMGLEGAGYALLIGQGAVWAPAVAALFEGGEVIVVGEESAGWGEARGVSRLAATGQLPFFARSLRGVALTEGAAGWLEEGARVLAPGGRLLLEGAPADAGPRLEAAGLQLLAEERGAVVAVRR